VSWSEVVQKATAYGVDTGGLREELEAVGLELVPFGTAEAEAAANLWLRGGRALSLADRACLATASVRGLSAVTADRAWASLAIGVPVQVCR
jgi:PIN domain nuclease of toxin-antitoxin system